MTDAEKILVELGKIQANQDKFAESHERNAQSIKSMDDKLDIVIPKVEKHGLALRITGWVGGTLFVALITAVTKIIL